MQISGTEIFASFAFKMPKRFLKAQIIARIFIVVVRWSSAICVAIVKTAVAVAAISA